MGVDWSIETCRQGCRGVLNDHCSLKTAGSGGCIDCLRLTCEGWLIDCDGVHGWGVSFFGWSGGLIDKSLLTISLERRVDWFTASGRKVWRGEVYWSIATNDRFGDEVDWLIASDTSLKFFFRIRFLIRIFGGLLNPDPCRGCGSGFKSRNNTSSWSEDWGLFLNLKHFYVVS